MINKFLKDLHVSRKKEHIWLISMNVDMGVDMKKKNNT